MTENTSVLENVLRWLHKGYPEGVPPKDYFALLALLKRSLTEDEVVKAAQSVLKSADSDTVTEDKIRRAIHQTSRLGTEPRGDPPGRVPAGLGRAGRWRRPDAEGVAPYVLRLIGPGDHSLWSRGAADQRRYKPTDLPLISSWTSHALG